MKVSLKALGRGGHRAVSGQAMVEYVLATGVLLAFATVMAIFLYALRLHADRVLNLIGLDHP